MFEYDKDDLELQITSTFLDNRTKNMECWKIISKNEDIFNLNSTIYSTINVVFNYLSNNNPANNNDNSLIKNNEPSKISFQNFKNTCYNTKVPIVQPSKKQTNEELLNIEIENYRIDEETNTDPIKFWLLKKDMYPNLYKVAIHILSINTTNVGAENLFSRSGHVCSKKRTSLTPTHLEQIVFLKDNNL